METYKIYIIYYSQLEFAQQSKQAEQEYLDRITE